MDPTILRLESDVWTIISSYLGYIEVNYLLSVGNALLSTKMGHGVRSLPCPPVVDHIDLNSIFTTCEALPNLQELRITPKENYIPLKTPPYPQRFPPKLTSLIATFPHAAHFFLRHTDLSCLASNLLRLKLKVSPSDLPHLGAIKFPTNLTSLSLESESVTIKAGDIALLPRGLTSLSISTNEIPIMTSYEWPPNLTSLKLRSLRQALTLEHLPRTVVTLRFSRVKLQTNFNPTTGVNLNMLFPWRAFFPSLQRLTVAESNKAPIGAFLESIVSAHAFDDALVASFIESGFWNLLNLEFDPKRVYPLMEHISAGHGSYHNFSGLEFFQRCAPFLTRLKTVFADFQVPAECLPYLPSLKSYKHVFGALPPRWGSPTLKVLVIGDITPEEIGLFPGLEELSVMRLSASQDVEWPRGLTSLTAYIPFRIDLAHNLPTSLTSLSVGETTLSAWTTIATQLINLRSLFVTLENTGSWDLSDALTPIASKSLVSFGLFQGNAGHNYYTRPYLYEFLGPNSPLPATLTSLEIASASEDSPIPMTICPYLPRQLRRLKLASSIQWQFERYHTEPHIDSLTPAQLLASLPPGLTSFNYFHTVGPIMPLNVEAIASMPPSLISFYVSGLFSENRASTIELKEQIIALAPPKLGFLWCDTLDLRADYFASRRPELYKVQNDAGQAQIVANKALWGY